MFSQKLSSKDNYINLRLICDDLNTKYGFVFLNKSNLVEHKYNKNNGQIKTKENFLHYIVDENYIYLEKIHENSGSYFRINKDSLYLNDNEENKCIILQTSILEFFSNLKKQHFN
tara:strand:+ start:2716 stop:3060 length:345 start_codon:yes stop_codon:yes gene_type:complete